MRHQKNKLKLSLNQAARKALLSQLIAQIIINEKAKTTTVKAKFAKSQLDRLITIGKKGDLTARRRLLASLQNNRQTVEKIITTLAPRFKNRTSGYTRIVKLGRRKGDGAPMARIELISEE